MAMNDPFLLLNSDFALQHAGYEEEKGVRERDSPQVDRLPLKGLSDGRTERRRGRRGKGESSGFLDAA